MENENILEKLQNLNIGEKIFIHINSDISNTMQYNQLTCQSYENLFQSYINNTCEQANKMNVTIFLEEYSKPFIQNELLKEAMLKNYLGQAYSYFISNIFNYNFNYQLNILEIYKLDTKRRIK